MACYRPLTGYRARYTTPSGRRPVVFSVVDGYRDLPVQLPCGQCIGCRLERARQWATRCVHEAQLHLHSCVVTLTYAEENLPVGHTLVPNDAKNFIRRLRRTSGFEASRYFLCGEYGGQFGRPHYHALLFGVWFGDSRPFKKSASGSQLYRSALAESLWPAGHVGIGEFSFESAAYAARYCVEKVNGEAAEGHYEGRYPEFVRMSRRPAIGRRWFERFSDDVYPEGEAVVSGRKGRSPLYYDRLLDKERPAVLEALKARRAVEAVKRLGDRSYRRLAVREELARARLSLYKNS